MIGLEPTFEEHLENLVAVFREVKRVLRHDGCLFLNYGDAHASCQMFSHQVQLREHLTEDEYVEAALALSRGMSELWAEDGEGTSEGSLSELLQQKEEGAVHGRPAAAAENAGSKQSVTCQASEEAQRQVGRKKSGKASLGHRTSGKSMRLLRRDGADFPVSRPHQRRRAPGTQETGGHDASVQTGNKGGSAAKQISGPMLELQRRSRAVGILSSLVIDKSDIPAGAERFFEPASNLKPKDLMMMPARVAMALQADGWWLRSEIIWHKPNPMPESVTDRPTNAHEKVFLLSKAARYFYDAEAVRVPGPGANSRGTGGKAKKNKDRNDANIQGPGWERRAEANLRNVWKIPTHSFKEAHFATFPPKLVEPCIKAGTSEKGCCAECGAPWVRVVEKEGGYEGARRHDDLGKLGLTRGTGWKGKDEATRTTTGWSPTCDHGSDPVPCVCLDPFSGAGTVGLVAQRLQRDAVLIEISPEYAEMSRKRIHGDMPLFSDVKVEEVPNKTKEDKR